MLANKKIVFSGFRDDDLAARIMAAGGKVTTAVSGLTNILVIKPDGKKGDAKLAKANALGSVEILLLDAFIAKYLKEQSGPVLYEVDYNDPTFKAICLAAYENEKVNISVRAFEKLLNTRLNPGDVVNLYDRYNLAYFVTSKYTWLKNPGISDSGVLVIPAAISDLFDDAIKTYSKIIINSDNHDFFGAIDLSRDDKTIRDIFAGEKDPIVLDVLKHATFSAREFNKRAEKELIIEEDEDEDDVPVELVLFELEIVYKKRHRVFQVTKNYTFFRQEVKHWLGTGTHIKHVELFVRPQWNINQDTFPINTTLVKPALIKMFPSKQWSAQPYNGGFNVRGIAKELDAFYRNLEK